MYKIIINPIAGKGQTLVKLPPLTRLFDAQNLPYEVLVTTCSMDAYEKAKAACQMGCTGIIGVGGDGTIQEIAAGMADAFPGKKIPIPLGIFPGGSGNDFIMTLAGGKKAALNRYKKCNQENSIRDFFDAVTTKRTTRVDIIKANGMAYLNIGNIGLDAKVVMNAIQYKQRYGRYAYVAAVYKSIARHKNMPLRLTIDGIEQEGDFTLVAVCNGQYYGGGLWISPQASLQDGEITVCLVKAMSRLKTMIIFPYLMLGRHHRLKAVSFMKCKNLSISIKSGAESLCMDGNLYAISSQNGSAYTQEKVKYHSAHMLAGADTGEVTFEIMPQALDIYL